MTTPRQIQQELANMLDKDLTEDEIIQAWEEDKLRIVEDSIDVIDAKIDGNRMNITIRTEPVVKMVILDFNFGAMSVESPPQQ